MRTVLQVPFARGRRCVRAKERALTRGTGGARSHRAPRRRVGDEGQGGARECVPGEGVSGLGLAAADDQRRTELLAEADAMRPPLKNDRVDSARTVVEREKRVMEVCAPACRRAPRSAANGVALWG